MLQGFHSRRAIGRQFRVRESDHLHVVGFQILHLVDVRLAAGGNPQGQHADGINGVATRRQQSFVVQFVYVFRVRRQENIEGRRVLDLGGQHRGRSKAEDRMDFGLRFEFRAQRLSHFGQVRRRRNCDLGSLAQRGPKRYDDQRSYGSAISSRTCRRCYCNTTELRIDTTHARNRESPRNAAAKARHLRGAARADCRSYAADHLRHGSRQLRPQHGRRVTAGASSRSEGGRSFHASPSRTHRSPLGRSDAAAGLGNAASRPAGAALPRK